MVYRRRWHTKEEGAEGRRTRGSSSFAGLGRFRRAGRAGRPAAPLPNRRIKTGGPYKYGAPYFRDGRVARRERASQRRLAPGEARPDAWTRCGRDGGRAVSRECAGRRRAISRELVCVTSRGRSSAWWRGWDFRMWRKGTRVQRGAEEELHTVAPPSSFFEALPNRMRTRRSPLHSEEKMCRREKPHACGGAEAVCEVGEGGEKGEGEAVNEQTFSPRRLALPLFVCVCFPL